MSTEKIAIFAWNSVGVSGDFTDKFFNGKPSHASTRLQLMPAMTAARQLGFSVRAISLAGNSGFLNNFDRPQVCVLSKMTLNHDQDINHVSSNALALCARMKARGVPIILLYCDHHAMYASPIGSLYRDLLGLADKVVTPTSKMAELANSYRSNLSSAVVVEDSCQIKRQRFGSLDEREPCRLLWFGNNSNLSFLTNILPNILVHCKAHSSFELTCMGRESALVRVRSIACKLKSKRPWAFRYVVWDSLNQPDQLEIELARAHLVLIPSDPKNIWKLGVSHNRLVDGVQGGCIVIASPMPSYIELSKISLVGNDFPAMIDAAISQYSRLSLKYDSLRNKFLSRFMPASIQSCWRDLLSS